MTYRTTSAPKYLPASKAAGQSELTVTPGDPVFVKTGIRFFLKHPKLNYAINTGNDAKYQDIIAGSHAVPLRAAPGLVAVIER